MDNEIIKINTDETGNKIVSAREMYEKLGLAKSQFSRWAKQNIVENPFAIESEDWEGFDIMLNGNQTTDFALKIPFAKKLAMQVKTEQGEQVRNYFLEMERLATLPVVELTPEEQLLSQVKMLAQSIEMSIETKRKQQELELAQKALISSHVEHQVRLDRIEARIQDDPAYFAVTGYANIHKFKITDKDAQYIGKLATKISNEWCVRIGKVRHNRWGLVNSYHESVLDYVFNSEMELVA